MGCCLRGLRVFLKRENRRCGELLVEEPPARENQHTKVLRDGAIPKHQGRTALANSKGLSERKRKVKGTVPFFLMLVGKHWANPKGPANARPLPPRSGPRHIGASMRVTLALAALPLAVFCLTPRAPARVLAPRAPTPVVSEGVRVIPLDAFNARWWPDQAPTSIRVKTVPVRVLTNEKPSEPVVEPAGVTAALPPPVKRYETRGATD